MASAGINNDNFSGSYKSSSEFCPVCDRLIIITQQIQEKNIRSTFCNLCFDYTVVLFHYLFFVLVFCCCFIVFLFFVFFYYKRQKAQLQGIHKKPRCQHVKFLIVISSIHYITVLTFVLLWFFFSLSPSTHWVGYVHNIFKLYIYTAQYE